MGVLKATAEDELFSLVRECAGRARDVRPQLVSVLGSFSDLSAALIGAAVRNAGSPAATRLVRAHLRKPKWSQRLPLGAQEYATVLGDEPRFHLSVSSALTRSRWAENHLSRLLEPQGVPREAAQQLLRDMHSITAEAGEILSLLLMMRARRRADLSVMQVQLLMRLEATLGKVRKRRILEVGPMKGGVFRELQRQGSDAWAVDLEPLFHHPNVLQGDFMTAELPGPFDAVVASAVFEPGAAGKAPDPRNAAPAVLARFRALTKPGGLVVLENICFAIPFSPDEARAAGFEPVSCRVPCIAAMGHDTGTALQLNAREELVLVERLPVAPVTTSPFLDAGWKGVCPAMSEDELRQYALGGRGCVLRHVRE